MANLIRLKRSSTSGAVPTTGQLELGEIAINTHDGKMYIKKDDGSQSIVTLEPVPTHSVVKFDDISSGFNDTDTTFSLTASSVAHSPADVNALLISVGGVIQQPGVDFTISGSSITFTTAPETGLSFFGIDLLVIT